jgi:hypothetical protein
MGGAVFPARREQLHCGSTQVMLRYIVEEQQYRRCPRQAGIRRAHGGCMTIVALFIVNDVHRHHLLLTPCARHAILMRATPSITRTGSQTGDCIDSGPGIIRSITRILMVRVSPMMFSHLFTTGLWGTLFFRLSVEVSIRLCGSTAYPLPRQLTSAVEPDCF